MKKLKILLGIFAIKANILFAMQRTPKRQCFQKAITREVFPQKFERTDNSNSSFRINSLNEYNSNTKVEAFTEDYKVAVESAQARRLKKQKAILKSNIENY